METEELTRHTIIKSPKISFRINGTLYSLKPGDKDYSPKTKLVDFIRETAGLTGTKYMCREGGCGACVVTIRYRTVTNEGFVVKSGNSCLIPVLSCNGWQISTIESLGNRKDGYSEIQHKMVEFAGSQCGFCTPGMIMTMTSDLKSNNGVPTGDIEDLLGGNICRCTGYRPILDAFKAVSGKGLKMELDTTGDDELEGRARDDNLEDFDEHSADINIQDQENDPELKDGEIDTGEEEELSNVNLRTKTGDIWFAPKTLVEIFRFIRHFNATGVKYRIVAGNTGTGVYKNEGPYEGYIDITRVPELKLYSADSTGVTIGSAVTLSHALRIFKDSAGKQEGLKYGTAVAKHLGRVASVHVRNIGTLGGNLMVKHNHPDFPSDLFLILVTLNATLTIASSAVRLDEVRMKDFLRYDMRNKVIVKAHVPPIGPLHCFHSFKVAKRYQNAISDVNAGFLMKISKDFVVLERPNIVYGGIQPKFVHASKTESYLKGKNLKDRSTIEEAMKILGKEVDPDGKDLVLTSPSYRRLLTQTLLYKAILSLLGSAVSPMNQSGGTELKRGKISGKQDFDSDSSVYPLNKPIDKLEAALQCSGEAIYINDIPKQPKELHGVFVLSTVGSAELKSVDASRALAQKGVVAFIQAKDIPGKNNFIQVFPNIPEEVFSSGKILYAGQPIGMILAETPTIANEAARMVSVQYRNVRKPVLNSTTVVSVVKIERDLPGYTEDLELVDLPTVKGPDPTGENVEQRSGKELSGSFSTEGQYHFHMETQNCLCIPEEDHLRIYPGTQWMLHCSAGVANVLGIPQNKITIIVKRLGGGFGAKFSRSTQMIAACAVGAKVTNRPVRVVMDLQSNMEMMGKRYPYHNNYKVTFDDKGKIQKLKVSIVFDMGRTSNDHDNEGIPHFQNCYDVTGWQVSTSVVQSELPPNTWTRAPGSAQNMAMIEEIMEHIAFELKLDPLEVRKANFIKPGSLLLVKDSTGKTKFEGENALISMIDQIKESADFVNRTAAVEAFNKSNRWKKRGMSLLPMLYNLDYSLFRQAAYVAVCGDGSVMVSTSGIEMGQGINTKVAQAVAYKLGIDVQRVEVSASQSLIGINAFGSAASITSERAVYAALKSCEMILERMEPVRTKLNNPPWEKLVPACLGMNIDLRATYMGSPEDKIMSYEIWGVTISEVEIDCLTGEHRIIRVDLLEDAGRSINPKVDVGQVEGAFVMGIGFWTTEQLIYDPNTGRLLTNNTWEYKPPTVADIPADFRVTLLKNRANPDGILRSKAIGEPPICMSVSVFFALKNAICAARKDAGIEEYLTIGGPLTQEKILRACQTNAQQLQI